MSVANMPKVLVYHYRHKDTKDTEPVIADGLEVMTTSELDDILHKHPELQRSTKPIAQNALSVTVYQHDLYTESQKTQWASKPNYGTNVAGLKVPLKVVLGRLFGSRDFDELVILSAERKEL